MRDRRRTRVVFPDRFARAVWGAIGSMVLAWAAWVSSGVVDLNHALGRIEGSLASCAKRSHGDFADNSPISGIGERVK